MTKRVEAPEMSRYSLSDEATDAQRTIFEAARAAFWNARWQRSEEYRAQHSNYNAEVAEDYAQGFERDAERKLSILRRKGVLIEL